MWVRVSKAIGRAADFYRIRLRAVDATDPVSFDWRDDILYRRTPVEQPEARVAYCAEAISLGDGLEESVTMLAQFADETSAGAWVDECREDLEAMTRAEFEATYFPEA